MNPITNRIGRAALACTLLLAAAGPAARGDGDAVALVNGRPINRADLVSALIESHGLTLLQQLILLDLARAESKQRSLSVSAADVEQEFERSLDQIAREANLTAGEATRENKLRALSALLEQRSLSMAEYRLTIERNAHLRRCIQQEIKIEEPTLREEFARTRGERVVVRHIQVADLRRLNPIIDELNRGGDFAAVAQRVSENRETAVNGGLMEPFTFGDSRIPPTLREAAFGLKPGEVSSAIRTGEYCHVLKLEQRLPPENVKFEDVRAEVEAAMRERVELGEMTRLMERLYRAAKIRVIEKPLRDKYEEFQKKATTPAEPSGKK